MRIQDSKGFDGIVASTAVLVAIVTFGGYRAGAQQPAQQPAPAATAK